MLSLFFNIIHKENKAYFVEQEKNLLIEYDCERKKVIHSLSLDSLGRSHLINDLRLFDDYLILFPCWYDSVIVVDLGSFEIVNVITLPDSLKEDMWCDYSPIFFDDIEEVYMYRRSEGNFLYRITRLKNDALFETIKFEGVIPQSVSGYKNAFVYEDKAYLVTNDPSDNLFCYSVSDNRMSMIKIDSVMIDKVYCNENNIWISDTEGTVYCCEKDGKLVFKTVPESKELIFESYDYTMIGDEKGIMIAGVYNDGSLLKIDDTGIQHREIIDGLSLSEIKNKWNESYSRLCFYSTDRVFIQKKDGSYYLGGGIQGKVYAPINIPLSTKGIGLIRENKENSLRNLIADMNC